MVQTKHQKGKQKKQPQVKRHGKQADISELRGQLDSLGLKIVQVTADGNCFFRALADQLEGNQEEHEKYRSMVVNNIKKNQEMFEPFIEDEVPFDGYCDSMEKDGRWAGHMELQAASLVTRANICIHRSLSPRWYIRNFDDKFSQMIHLSYHDGEHYNSVRSKEDPCDGAAKPIVIKADANLTAKPHQAKSAVTPSQRRGFENFAHPGSIKMVISGSGCGDAERVEQVLRQVHGDVDAAIEYLIAERGSEDTRVENREVDCQTDSREDNGSSKLHESLVDTTGKHNQASKARQNAHNGDKSSKNDKKIPRNKACPCGSKKKYKSCCGTATSSKLKVEDADELPKGKKQGKKGVAVSASSSEGSLDLGALCI